MRHLSPHFCCLVLIASGFSVGCDGDRKETAREPRGGAEAVPVEVDTETEPPVIEIIRHAEAQEAKMKVEDHVVELKAYRGTALEQKLASEYVRRAELWHQVRVQQILIGEAEKAKDETKLAEATSLLALRLSEVKKSEEEWLAVEKGGWKKEDSP